MTVELVERAQRGDHEAFDVLATAAYHRLYAIARRILRDGYAAEDAVQDALVRAWRDLRSLRDPDRFDAWLHRLLVNACHDQVRRTRRRPVAVEGIDADPGGPEAGFGAVVDRDELERAFLGLSVDQRAALVLTHYVGMSAVEVAADPRGPAGDRLLTTPLRRQGDARDPHVVRRAVCSPGGRAMNEPIERALADWLRDGPDTGPREGLHATLAATRRTRQRPTWTFVERWLPMQLTMQRGPAPRQLALLFLLVLLLAAVAATAVFIGSQRREAPLTGPAANGLVLYDSGGTLWAIDGDATPRALSIGLGEALNPSHSPDGTQLAFWTRTGERTPWSIYVADADGGNARNLTGDMQLAPEPWANITWEPGGGRIAFATSENGTNVVYVAPSDGSGPPVRLSEADGDRSAPIWSPDGRWIAYRLRRMSDDGAVHLAIAGPDGSAEQVLATDPMPNASFRGSQWAPDSTRVAYFRQENGRHVVGVVDLDGQETIITPADTEGFNPVWSPDGTKIAYALEGGGAVVAAPDGTEISQIPVGLAGCGIAWAPDGTSMLGLGTDCEKIVRFPVDDPSAAELLFEGAIGGLSWQRTAP